MRGKTGVGSKRSWTAARGLMWLALAVGCTAAPLDGKPCPCVPDSGYVCCETTLTCMTDLAQCPPGPCASKPLSDLVLTSKGTSVPAAPGAGTDSAVMFGDYPEQWVTYVYAGTVEFNPTLVGTSDGSGFQVHASFQPLADDSTQAFEGIGLTFLGDGCVDGSQLTRLDFDYEGNAEQLQVGVVSVGDVSTAYRNGLCTAGPKCYGPAASFIPNTGTNEVFLDRLSGGMPELRLDRAHIMNVQWQVPASGRLNVDFTIRNVRFF